VQILDQLRAAHALKWVNDCNTHHKEPTLGRRDAAKRPAILLRNGLLAALAFACDEGKGPRAGLAKVCTGIASQPRTVSTDLYEAMQHDRILEPFNP
jgi:hypothetical protein